MKHSSLPILVLAASCNMLLVSGLEKSSVEYRRNRKSHVVHDQEQALVLPRKDDEANQLRHAISRRTNSNQSSEDQQLERQATNSSNRRRTRGSKSNTKRQSRRELSKSSGKSGSKSSSKSGSSSSSGGSSSGGGSSGSGGSSGGGSDSSQKSSGYNSDDGTYCGCLCDNAYSDYGFDTHGISCDYHVEEYSYGEGVSDPHPDNSDALMAEYFTYNRYTKWAVIEESSTDDFFTNGGNWNYDEEEAEGRADDGYQNDEDDAAQAEAVVIEELVDDYDPYAAFDIGKCDTYSHLWTYDLFSSCSEGDQYCECTYAEQLIDRGLLSCSDLSLCPSECGVCSTCLHSICDEYLPSQLIATGFQSNQGYALAAVITTVVLAAWVSNKRKRPKGGILGESLMDADGIPYTKRDWKVRIGKDGLPTEKKSWKDKKLQVWLAPDVSTIPKKQPLFPDLLPNPDEKNKKQNIMEMSNVASSKKRSKRLHMAAPVIVMSDKVSVASSLSHGGGVDEDGLSTRSHSESLRGFEGDI